MIKDINYSGYSTSPSDYECADGSLAAAMNVIPEDGHLKTVFRPNTKHIFGENETPLFIHKTSRYKHYIVWRAKKSSASNVPESGEQTEPTEPTTGYEQSGEIEDPEQAGSDYEQSGEIEDDPEQAEDYDSPSTEEEQPSDLPEPEIYGLVWYDEDFTFGGSIETPAEFKEVDKVQVSAMGNVVTLCIPGVCFFYILFDTEENGYKYIDPDIPPLNIRFCLDGDIVRKAYRDTGVEFKKLYADGLTYTNIVGRFNSVTREWSPWIKVNVIKGKSYELNWGNHYLVSSMLYQFSNDAANAFYEDSMEINGHTYHRWSQGFSAKYLRIRYGDEASDTESGTATLYESDDVEGWGIKNDENSYNAVLGACNDYIARCHKDNKFMYPFFVRYALRMFDGTYTCHSAPILMIPGAADNPRAYRDEEYGNNVLALSAVQCKLMYTVVGSANRLKLKYIKERYKSLITGVDVFVSAPIYTYDQGRAFDKSSSNIPKYIEDFLTTAGSYKDPNVTFARVMSMDANLIGRYTNFEINSYLSPGFEDNNFIKIPQFTTDEVRRKIEETALFYKIASIDVEDLEASSVNEEDADKFNSWNWKEVPIIGTPLTSLVTRETLDDDTLKSHNVKFAQTLTAYNNRLAISFQKETIFNGWAPTCCAGVSNPNDVYERKQIARIFLTTDDGEKIVNTEFEFLPSDDILYLFYPDSRAKRAEIYIRRYENGTHYKNILTVQLKQHPTLNGSYWLGDWEYDKSNSMIMLERRVSDITPKFNFNNIYNGTTRIYSSEVNNPFAFASATDIGAKVERFSSAAKALSQGQFGQFPLYAFTTEGVWALEVSATGTYTAKQPITRDVCINPDSITQLDSAVLFATDRGIMLLIGSEASCISDTINAEQPFNVMSLPAMDKLSKLIYPVAKDCLPTAPFLKFLAGSAMVYDYTHQRVIVFNPEYSYAYVYSMRSKEWGMTTSNLLSTLNSYPDALAFTKEHKLVSFSENSQVPVRGLFVTRPMKLDAPDVLKTVDTVIQRGQFAKGDVNTVLYGSRDLYNWFVVWSSVDHTLRGFRGTPYKYFRIASVTRLTEDKSVSGAAVQFTPRHTNVLR